MLQSITLRKIEPGDNEALARIIRNSLEEFGAAKPGTVYFDPTTDFLSSVFKEDRSEYFVATRDGEILGGAGIYPTKSLPADTCELVKLYLAPAARGLGLGKLLMETCEAAAAAKSYKAVYLETMPELKIAVPLYEKLGYRYLENPMGNSGHTGCDIWMIKHIGKDSL